MISHILPYDSSVILCSFKREQSREKQFPPLLFNNFPDTKSTKDRIETLFKHLDWATIRSITLENTIVSLGIVHEENSISEQYWRDKLGDCTQYLHMKA